MGESTAKITVDMDARRVQQQAEAVKQKFHETKDKAHGIGDELEKMGHHLGRHVISAAAILKTFESIGKAVREYQKGAIEASKSMDDNTVTRGQAGAGLGLNVAQTDAFTAPGAKSRKERTSFLSQLSGVRLGGNRRLSPAEVARASALSNTGVFEDGEIIEAVRRGGLGELERNTAKRFELIGEEGRAALARKASDNQTADDVEGTGAARVGNLRARQNEIARRNAAHPVAAAFQTAVGDLTGHIGGKDIIEAADNSSSGVGSRIASFFAGLAGGGVGAGAGNVLRSDAAGRTADATERMAGNLDRPALPPPVE